MIREANKYFETEKEIPSSYSLDLNLGSTGTEFPKWHITCGDSYVRQLLPTIVMLIFFGEFITISLLTYLIFTLLM